MKMRMDGLTDGEDEEHEDEDGEHEESTKVSTNDIERQQREMGRLRWGDGGGSGG